MFPQFRYVDAHRAVDVLECPLTEIIKGELGLARVKAPFRGSRREGRASSVSGRDRGHLWLGPNDVHDPRQIIGQDREGHLGGYFWEGFGQEVRRTHARLHGAERMLDGLAT